MADADLGARRRHDDAAHARPALTVPDGGHRRPRRARRPRRPRASSTACPSPTGCPTGSSQDELDHYVAEFTRTGFTGGINWYRNFDRNWELTEHLAGAKVTVPSLFIGGSADPVLHHEPGRRSWTAGSTDHRGDVPRRRRRPLGAAGGARRGQRRPARRSSTHSTSEVADHARPLAPALRRLLRAVPPGRAEPDAGARVRPRAGRGARPARLRRGLVRRAPLRRLRAHRLPRDLHRRRRRADQAHQARHRRGVAAVPPPVAAWPTASCCSTTSPAAGCIFGAGPGALPDRRLHHGHRPGRPAPDDGGVASRRSSPSSRSEEPVTRETDWFTIRDGQPADAAVHPPAPRGRGGRHGDAVGPAPRRPARRRRCCRCRCRWPRASPPSARRGASSRSRPSKARAARSPTAARWRILGNLHIAETTRAGHRGLHLRPQGLLQLLRRRRRLRAARQQGRGRARHRARRSSSATPRPAAW